MHYFWRSHCGVKHLSWKRDIELEGGDSGEMYGSSDKAKRGDWEKAEFAKKNMGKQAKKQAIVNMRRCKDVEPVLDDSYLAGTACCN
mmetsp:Transcript_89595/g.187154  ORF Transcript_89595/g.187154 Transcript_89595/m.187154 type:complete len:87 (+) Transcript_89595:323-583(+)